MLSLQLATAGLAQVGPLPVQPRELVGGHRSIRLVGDTQVLDTRRAVQDLAVPVDDTDGYKTVNVRRAGLCRVSRIAFS